VKKTKGKKVWNRQRAINQINKENKTKRKTHREKESGRECRK
jgi:hypothetical protein